MELDEFVQATLRQILRGVRDAQEEAGQLGATVNPTHSSGKFGNFHAASGTYIQNVEFDVGLSVTESSESGAGLRVGIPWIGGGLEAVKEASQDSREPERTDHSKAEPCHCETRQIPWLPVFVEGVVGGAASSGSTTAHS